MIDDAPAIQFFTDFERPDDQDVDALRGLQSGFVVDALGGQGALDFRIKPVDPEQSALCGVVLTCDCGAADNLAVAAALKRARPGDVLVAATGAHTGCAVVGDLVLGMARNNGIAGFVTDGCVRDTRGIREVGLPCFALGVSPNSPARNGPGTVGAPVVIGGVAIASGDIVVADEDGVVIVPRARVAATIARLADVRRKEDEMTAKVADGLKGFDFI
ncbi:MAG: 4-hydroxy-4-methyl-2-oxoglutarate aldolase [Burkholderiaceae bacterium]